MLRDRDIAMSFAMIQRSCVLLAVIGMFLQGSEGGHMLLVEHTRCAEHGDLVHAGDAHGHGVEAALVAETRTIEGAPDPSGDSAHEHCNHASEQRRAVAGVPPSHLRARYELAPAVRAPIVVALPIRAPLFRTAPKTSPPA